MTTQTQPNSPSPPGGRDPLFDLRLLVLVTVSALIGALVGTLTWHAAENTWAAVLAALGAAGVALERLHAWTGP